MVLHHILGKLKFFNYELLNNSEEDRNCHYIDPLYNLSDCLESLEFSF